MPQDKKTIATPLFAVAAALFSFASAAVAQSGWPAKPVKFLVPVAPGGAPEAVNRLLADRLANKWGVQILIENKPSAGLIVATEQVARAAPDGYTLLSTLTAHVQVPSLFRNLPFDTMRDFAPITQSVEVDTIFAVRADLPVKNMKEFIALAKASPTQLTYGSTGQGSTYHLNGSALSRATGTNLLHVPYKGAVAALNDLVGGRIDSTFGAFPTMMAMVRAGRVRPLAIVSLNRSPLLPDLPTVAELGVTRLSSWFGLLAPRATPPDIVRRISGDVRDIVRDPEVGRKFSDEGFRMVGSTPEEFAAMLEFNLAGWKKIITESGIQASD